MTTRAPLLALLAVVGCATVGVKEVANAVVHMANLPLATNIQFITIMASAAAIVIGIHSHAAAVNWQS